MHTSTRKLFRYVRALPIKVQKISTNPNKNVDKSELSRKIVGKLHARVVYHSNTFSLKKANDTPRFYASLRQGQLYGTRLPTTLLQLLQHSICDTFSHPWTLTIANVPPGAIYPFCAKWIFSVVSGTGFPHCLNAMTGQNFNVLAEGMQGACPAHISLLASTTASNSLSAW